MGSEMCIRDSTVAMPVDGEIILGGGRGIASYPGIFPVAGISAGQDEVTVGIFNKSLGTGYVTGWLVGIDGPVKGRDYRIMHGKNWIGRTYNMDICITEGADIAVVNQCAIVYDGKGNQFFIIPGMGTTTYLNSELVGKPEKLKLGDEIKMGNCTFEFIPFCREGHIWEVEGLCGED